MTNEAPFCSAQYFTSQAFSVFLVYQRANPDALVLPAQLVNEIRALLKQSLNALRESAYLFGGIPHYQQELSWKNFLTGIEIDAGLAQASKYFEILTTPFHSEPAIVTATDHAFTYVDQFFKVVYLDNIEAEIANCIDS